METSFYKKPMTCHLAVHLLLSAAWKDHDQIIGGKNITIKRGQIPCGRNTLAEQTGMSPQNIRTCINHLVKCGFLTIESTSQCSIITIKKYNEFQSQQPCSQPTNQPTTNQRPTNDQPLQNKGYKDINKNTPLISPQGEATWKTDFEIYLNQCRESYSKLIKDKNWMCEQSRLNPGVHIKLTMEKAATNFWATEAGWKHKKKKRSVSDINWQLTWQNALTQKQNRIYEDSVSKTTSAGSTCPPVINQESRYADEN